MLEDVADDVDVNDWLDLGVLVRVGNFARGPLIVIAEVLVRLERLELVGKFAPDGFGGVE